MCAALGFYHYLIWMPPQVIRSLIWRRSGVERGSGGEGGGVLRAEFRGSSGCGGVCGEVGRSLGRLWWRVIGVRLGACWVVSKWGEGGVGDNFSKSPR